MTQLTTALFDLDGTLLDSIELILASFHHVAAVHHLPTRDDAAWMSGIGRPLRDQLASVASNEQELTQMVATFREHNLSHHDELARPFAGAADVVRALKRRGVKLALVTSKLHRGTDSGLALLGLEDAFGAVVCADDVTHGKPDPEPVRLALSMLGSAHDESVFIGDSPHDMQAGRAGGVRTAAALWGPFSRAALTATTPDVWLESLDDILALPFAGDVDK
jgi:pyrophosphatase PpaX